jgi:uncharacterized sulfatase
VLNKYKLFSAKAAKAFFVALSLFALFRVVEIVLLAFTDSLKPYFLPELCGLLDDFASLAYCIAIVSIPSFLVFIFAEKAGTILIVTLSSFITLIELCLKIYFVATSVLLDEALFFYSWPDVKYILESTGLNYLLVLVLLTTFGAAVFYLLHKQIAKANYANWMLSFFPLIIIVAIFNRQVINLSVEGNKLLSVEISKSFFFFDRVHLHIKRKNKNLSPEELKMAAAFFHKQHREKEFVSDEYPFQSNTQPPDVLSPYFNLSSDVKPNIVFLIVEGLGSIFSGNETRYGSFTPFIDSLAKHSLYFPNTLSTCERTFGVLPSLLGSLPYADQGFTKANGKKRYPKHFSLIKILNENNYQASFFYGGMSHFTNYDDFMREQGTNYVADEKNDGSWYSWGMSDDDLYNTAFKKIVSGKPAMPQVQVYLTLSTHHPFTVPNQDFYFKKFNSMLDTMTVNEKLKTEIKSYITNLSSVLYADDALRRFFKTYSSLPQYANTIFVITGDHAMPEIALQNSYVDCYRIPLLIFSPIIKNPKTFPAVTSHWAVAPSILALLNAKCAIQMPAVNHWMSNGLDTFPHYRCNVQMPFMHNNAAMVDYLSGNYFLADNTLYNISRGLNNKKTITDDNTKWIVKERLQNFIALNHYVCYLDKIIDKKSVDDFYNRKK